MQNEAGAVCPNTAGEFARVCAYRFPDLSGRAFLDATCRDGFLCGFALWAGASPVVGLTSVPVVCEQDAARFPEADFRLGSWDGLEDGAFDVIVLAATAADDLTCMIDSLVGRLSRRGVLVIEIPPGCGESVRACCDTRGLAFRFAWRSGWITPGGDVGDVVHVSRPVPDAWLLLGPSTIGKTTKARQLEHLPNAVHVCADQVIVRILEGSRDEPAWLHVPLAGVTPFTLNLAYEAIVEQGLEAELAALVLADVEPGQVPVVDMYLPAAGIERFAEAVEDLGFNAVRPVWRHPLGELTPLEEDPRLSAYAAALSAPGGI